ncbi:MAG: TatD family hydrolase [Bacteroidota bacterium]|nr:MAG: TatD family hydrolase [Bacteroidota bacterium]
MYIDIHRHSADRGEADLVVRNLYHTEVSEIQQTPYCSVGVHPWHIHEAVSQDIIDKLGNSAKNSHVLAIGETGLDKSIETKLEWQLDAFQKQLEIAKSINKPMIIHCVRAYNELQLLRKNSAHQQAWIFHWFNASAQTAFDLIHKGCYLSFGHMLFKENTKAYQAFLEIPVERIFLETDDAAISIKEVYAKAAGLKHLSGEQMQAQIKSNFKHCFGFEV